MRPHTRSTLVAAAAAVLGVAAVAAVAAGGAAGPGEPSGPAGASVSGAVAVSAPAALRTGQEAPEITVYKSPACGCCAKWVDHLEAAGFRVTALDVEDVEAVKRKHGVPGDLSSCHTAVAGGYVIEGHVPADLIARLLEESPGDVAGLAVPGMPIGSPGMEGSRVDAYDVVSFTRDGSRRVYASR